MIENQKEVTLNEFKAWLVGLIRGKNGKLPDLEDWKLIKEMLDKVVPEQTIVTIKEKEDPFGPWKTDPYKYYPPTWVGDPPPSSVPTIWCSDNTEPYSGDYTVSNTSDVKVDIDIDALLKIVEEWDTKYKNG